MIILRRLQGFAHIAFLPKAGSEVFGCKGQKSWKPVVAAGQDDVRQFELAGFFAG